MSYQHSIQRTWSVTLIALATATVTLAAQDQPDFSGRWVLLDSRQSAADHARISTFDLTDARAGSQLVRAVRRSATVVTRRDAGKGLARKATLAPAVAPAGITSL